MIPGLKLYNYHCSLAFVDKWNWGNYYGCQWVKKNKWSDDLTSSCYQVSDLKKTREYPNNFFKGLEYICTDCMEIIGKIRRQEEEKQKLSQKGQDFQELQQEQQPQSQLEKENLKRDIPKQNFYQPPQSSNPSRLTNPPSSSRRFGDFAPYFLTAIIFFFLGLLSRKLFPHFNSSANKKNIKKSY